MEIALISDTHNNYLNLSKAFNIIKKDKINVLIHCGDITSPETLKIILDNFSGLIYISLGNGDDKDNFIEFNRQNSNLFIFDDFGEIKFNDIEIAITHFPDMALNLIKNLKYKYIFYGHTHKPWLEKINDTIMLNPGNLAGLIYHPTFAICDLKNLRCRLIRL